MGGINFGAVDPQSAYKGVQATNALLAGFAARRAGGQIASGDTQGAQDTLNREGDLQGAQQVQDHAWANDERVRKMNEDEQKRQAQFTLETSGALYNVLQQHVQDPDHGVGAVTAAFDQLTPVFQHMGMDQNGIDTLKAALVKDPATILQAIHGQAQQHLLILSPGSRAVDPITGQVRASAPFAPQTKVVTDGDGTQHLIQVNPDGSDGPPAPAPAAPPQPAAAPAAPQAPAGDATGTPTQDTLGRPVPPPPPAPDAGAAPAAGSLDGHRFFTDFVSKVEGGLNPHDANGSPTNFGFNQAANPDIDVRKLTLASAADRYAAPGGYYQRSGAPNLPPALAAVHADTYFINPKRATEFLAESGGDPAKYMQLRAAWMEHLIATDPEKYGTYAHAWRTRNAALEQYSAGLGGGTPTPAAPAQPAGGSRVTELFTGKPKPAPPPKPETGFTLSPGATRYDAQGHVVATAPAKPTNGSGTVKLTPQDGTYLNTVRKAADETQGVVPLMQEFIDLNREVETGGALAMPGASTVMSAFNPKIARMKAIMDRLTPAMRNGLPGAASDKDVAMFRSATVGLDKPYEANVATAAAFQAWAQRQGDYAAFLEAFAKKNGNLLGAREQWATFAERHPLFSPGGIDGMIKVNPRGNWRAEINMDAPDGAPAPSGGRTELHWDPATRSFKPKAQ